MNLYSAQLFVSKFSFYFKEIDMFNSQEPENQWVMHSGFNPIIDFCIWVLEIDGLLASPFNQHPEGNRTLRAEGMNAESWLLWVKQVVLLADQRIYWHVENLQAEIQETQDSYERVAFGVLTKLPNRFFPAIGSDTLTESATIFANWKEWQYQQAATAAKEVFRFELPTRPPMPPDLWYEASIVRRLLEEMWVHYRSNVFSVREQRWHTSPVAPSLTSELAEVMRFYYPRLAALELHLVAYPSPVEYLVSPASVILSLTNDPNSSNIIDRAIRAVESLVN